MVKGIPFLSAIVMASVRERRVRRAAAILEATNLFPDSRSEIIEDYAYATSRTHRGIMQVINLESVLRYVETAGIEGAFVETGTYTGGASAYALRALQRLRPSKPARDYWGFDSFEGMPSPSGHDGDHGSLWIYGKPRTEIGIGESAALVGHDVNKAEYQECLSYLRQTGYPVEHIHLVKGWFQDTLGPAKADIGPIAVLRMDGDFYESTKVVFEELYDQVVPNGVVIIDDYGSFEGCRTATDKFFAMHGIRSHLVYVEHGIRYFTKSNDQSK
jgi:hypothetical protein